MLRRGSLSIDLLLVCGVAAAYVYSAVSVMRDAGPIYFEVGCVILVLVNLGRWLEATGKLHAGAALDELQKLLPEQVRVREGDRERFVPIADVRVDDCLRVLPGERIPTDGRLLSSALHADEQIVTGESRPVLKQAGDELRGGTLNLDADCLFQATALPGDGTLARLIRMVRQAREATGHYQRLADRLAGGMLPVVAVLAVGAGAWHAWHSGINHGALVGLSVVLVACPCSLGLATPLAIWAGLGLAARHQVLFRDSEALERLATIRAIRFDKTGTLTTGLAHVEEFISDPGSPPAEVLARGAALAGSSTHPFSRAIREFATGCQCIGNSANGSVHEDPRCIDVRLVAGRGVSGRFPHKSSETLFLGNQWWMVESGLQLSDVLTRVVDVAIASGRSLSLVGWDGRVKGAFVLSERLRPSAAQAL
jgi:cation transport ATPase